MKGGSGTSQYWCAAQKINQVSNNLMLNPNEQIVISVGLPDSTTPNQQFTINFQPSEGSALPLTRTIPGTITAVQAVY
jgi:archaellin